MSGSVVVALGAAGLIWLAADEQAVPAPERSAVVQRGTVTSTVSAAGTAEPLTSRSLNFSTGGTLTELNVSPGQLVETGAVLARIDDTAAVSAIEAAQAQLSDAEQAVERARSNSVSEVDLAPAGYRADPQAHSANAVVPSADPTGAASPTASPVDGQPTANPTGRVTDSGQQPGRGASASQPAAGGTAGTRAGTGGDSLLTAELQLNAAKLALKRAQATLAGTTISAPIAGKILSVAGAVGASVAVTTSGFIVLASTADVAVRAEFTEAEVARIATGQQATITFPARPGLECSGSVVQLAPVGAISDKLVRYAAIIAFDTVPAGVLYGQSAHVAVVTAASENVLLVPLSAVTDRNGSAGTVFVKVGDRVSRRAVRLGLSGDTTVEICDGLVAGETVVSGQQAVTGRRTVGSQE